MFNVKFFTDTYIWKKDPRHFFLILSSFKNPCKDTYLNPEQRKPSKFRLSGVEGIEHYTLSISLKYANSLENAKDANGFTRILLQKLTEEGIKNLYPDLWIEYHNHQARRQNSIEQQERNRLKKLGKLPHVDGYIRHITQGVSIRESASWSL